MSLIITIGRQFGSGGRDVGEKVAEYFNIPFYDKELVELAAQKSNISKEALKEVDEHATNSFLYSLASGNYSMRGINAPIYYEMPINYLSHRLTLLKRLQREALALSSDVVQIMFLKMKMWTF